MTDELGPNGPDETPIASEREIAAVEALFARADGDGSLWADPPVDGEARLVAAIGTGAAPANVDGRDSDEAADVAAVDVGDRRRSVRPRFTTTSWLAIAAALVVVVTGIALVVRSGDDSTAFALSGTDRAPEASAEVEVSDTPVGLKILLTPEGLPAAPEGTYYECWLSDGDVRVSAGTFHLRGGSGEIELWAGVVGPDFTHLAVTLEPIDDDLDSSGDAYLRGTFRLDD